MSSSVADLSETVPAKQTVSLWSWALARQFGFSLADQGLSVGGMFLVNIALARTQSKDEYGVFVLCYSIYTFLTGLHNAAILETYTVYGSGRYSKNFAEYEALLWRANGLLGLILTATLLMVWVGISWAGPAFRTNSLLGMALVSVVLLTASFVRRTFYMRRRPDLAARFSAVYFVTCSLLLWGSLRTGLLSGFTAFLIAGLAWCAAGASVLGELPGKRSRRSFKEIEPRYWGQHWKYARWVLVTAFIFQFTWQGYYWLAGAYLSVPQVADLRSMYNLVSPVDQIFVAMSLLLIPWMSNRFAVHRMAGLLPAWRFYAASVFAITLTFAILVNSMSARAMHIVYAGRFDDIAPLLGILAFLPVVMGIGNTMNDALKSAEKPKRVFYAYLCSGTATFLFGIPLVVRFGLRGAVYGMLLTAATYTVALGISLAFQSRQSIVDSPIPASDSVPKISSDSAPKFYVV